MRHEFEELFDTTPDLTGGDLDVSRFIRSGDERDVYVFWLELEKGAVLSAKRKPGWRELCAVVVVILPGGPAEPTRHRLAWTREDCHHKYMRTVFDAAGGNEGLRRLADAWHRRVMADEVVAHAFSHGFNPMHVERLAAYWAEALGGPTTYSDSYGDETTVVRMHSGDGEHDEMDRRAIACFDHALADVGLASDGTLRKVLHDYFAWATTTTMSRYHQSADDVPIGLRIPHWSWNGLQV